MLDQGDVQEEAAQEEWPAAPAQYNNNTKISSHVSTNGRAAQRYTPGKRAAGIALSAALHCAVTFILLQSWIYRPPSGTAIPPPKLVVFDIPSLPPAPPAAEPPSPASPAGPPARNDNKALSPSFPAAEALPAPHLASLAISPIAPDIILAPALADSVPPPAGTPDGQDSFEGRLLARIEQFRRYPEEALRKNHQGIVEIRFTMNRDGEVLDIAVVKGSGTPSLNRAAIATVRRAQPLPGIPDDRPDIVTVTVPVEFFITDGAADIQPRTSASDRE
ncbi:energy transducer TonB [Altericroceibacterium spongiae]|uniref:Energy transducer TonB n=1 Tax=Altericroceibacterium spongiae TaxID=2320269 RepID=A0A420EPR6_9SPHN|nr:energy transducer TonB [Altericroceibacterium spongiae]RKF22672.1 energy transducer TonB [Altericroceibacterium spongiae]